MQVLKVNLVLVFPKLINDILNTLQNLVLFSILFVFYAQVLNNATSPRLQRGVNSIEFETPYHVDHHTI